MLRMHLSLAFGVIRPYYIGEGFCVPGALLFADTDDELEIAWQDSARTRISMVTARRTAGRWATPAGVRVGTTLAELEELNGGPFTLSGFGWDYGGGLGSWENGRLAGTLTEGIHFRFDADDDALLALGGGPAVEALHREQLVRSDHPSAQRAGITVVFGPLPEEEFCG